MSKEQHFEALASFFKAHPAECSSNFDVKSMSVKGKKVNYENYEHVRKLFTVDDVVNHGLADFYKLEPADYIGTFAEFVELNFRSDLKEQRERSRKLDEKLTTSEDFDYPEADYIVDNLLPARVLGDNRRESGFVFIDRNTNFKTDYDYWAIRYALQRVFPAKAIDKYFSHHVHLHDFYDPHAGNSIEKLEGSNNVYAYNRYVPAAWRALDATPRIDPDTEKLMAHLFPNERCREFVYTWIYHSLTSRAGTYLYLCGGQGSGKNTLAGLITALHGHHNSVHPKQDSFKARFNHFLKDRSFVFFDEFNCRVRQDKDILKQIINPRIQVEGKNRDHEDVDVHASYFLANNSLEAIGMDPIDRRFSVPEVTHEPIINTLGRDWITAYIKKFEDDQWIADFGAWILEEFKKPRFLAEEPYQTKRFEEIVLSTARAGIAETLGKALLAKQDKYDYYAEKDLFSRTSKNTRYPNIADWQKFFREVHVDGEALGKVEGKTFTPRAEYRPQVDEDDI